jgi:hypothetical protein
MVKFYLVLNLRFVEFNGTTHVLGLFLINKAFELSGVNLAYNYIKGTKLSIKHDLSMSAITTFYFNHHKKNYSVQ